MRQDKPLQSDTRKWRNVGSARACNRGKQHAKEAETACNRGKQCATGAADAATEAERQHAKEPERECDKALRARHLCWRTKL